MLVDEENKLIKELDMLKHEHQGLDQLLNDVNHYDQLTLQRLKKRKLWLKDKISQLESLLYPDIIA